MSSSSRLSRFLLWFSSSLRMLGEVKLLSSPNLAFFFSPAKTRSLQRRRHLSDEVKFLLSLFFFSLQVNFYYRNHNFNSKVRDGVFCLHFKSKFHGIKTFGVGLRPWGAAVGDLTSSRKLSPRNFGVKIMISITKFTCRKKKWSESGNLTS